MKKAFAPKSKASRRRARQTFRGLIVAVAFGALVSVPLLSRYTRTVHAAGGVSLNTIGVASTQNFNTLPSSGSATWTNDSTIPGWYHARTGTGTTIVADVGTNTAGNLYSYGAAANTDRALGSLGSGNASAGNFFWGVILTNNTGVTVTALTVAYTGEQWRNSAAAAQTIAFSYLTGGSLTGSLADFQTAGTNVTALDFTSPITGGTAGALDGNAAANRTAKSFTITGLNLANGAQILLRWSDPDHTGTDHGLAIDDFSVTPLGGPIGTNGYRTTDIQGTDDGGYAMVLQPDGKIVVGGYSVNGSGNKDFALVRYNYNGTLDTTFNGTGKVTTDFNGTSDRIWGLALQSDGKIVAAGETVALAPPSTNDIAVARYNTNGTLDTTFNVTGKVTTDHGGGANNSAYAVALQGTNIVVAGVEKVGSVTNFMAARYTSAGVLDPTFGTLGVTTVGFSGFNDVARAVAIDGSSNIILGGYSSSGLNDDFAIARLTSTGALDGTFAGGAGKAAVDLANGGPGSADQAFALGRDGAGRIILAGSSYNNGTGNKDFAMVCYTSTGALDIAGFGGGSGVKITDFASSPDIAQAIFARANGSFVVGGFSRYPTSSDDFAIASYNSSGGPDTSFNTSGRLTFKISNNDERIYAIAEEFDGKIVVAGFATAANPAQHDFAVARFNANGTIDSTNATTLNQPDLLTEKVGPLNPNSVVAGQNFTYQISVTNRGAVAATNVVITDPLPAAVTYVSHVASTGSSNQSAGTVTNNVGLLNPGATATLTITVTASNTPQLVSNTATATLTETDATPGNNAATEYTRIIGLIDLSFIPSTVTGGCQNSTGTVTLSGEAPFGGANVTISSADPNAASAPPTVTVLQGQTQASFQVTTSPVVSNKQVRFQADLGPTQFVRRLVVNAGLCQ